MSHRPRPPCRLLRRIRHAALAVVFVHAGSASAQAPPDVPPAGPAGPVVRPGAPPVGPPTPPAVAAPAAPPPPPGGDTKPPAAAPDPAKTPEAAKSPDEQLRNPAAETARPPAAPVSAVPAAPAGPLPRADDARGLARAQPTSPEDYGLLFPRVVLFPVRLVVKAISIPLREAAKLVERRSLSARAERFFYNREKSGAVLPTFQFLSSQGPTIGVQAFHGNLAGHGERIEASAQIGGTFSQAYEAAFSADRTGGSRLYLDSVLRYEKRPRLLFQGIGDDPLTSAGTAPGALVGPREAAVMTRYGQERLLVAQRAGYTVGAPGSQLKLGGAAILNQRSFSLPSTPGFALLDNRANVPTQTVYDTKRIVGFDEGVRTLELSATLLLDTRDTQGRTSSGSYLDAFLGGVPPLGKYKYVHYGFDAATFVDLYRQTRVLVLRFGVEAVEGERDDIPFTDLPRLGGPTRLRGYRLDRFRDEKAALATVEYQYPIHKNISGALFVDAGRVAYNYPGLIQPRQWRAGVGAGLRLHATDKVMFSFDVAYGDDVLVFFTTTPLRAFQNRERQL